MSYAYYPVHAKASPTGKTQMPVEAPGVPTPYEVHVHPYPTRFHGSIWKRPVFGLPAVKNVESNFMPSNMDPSMRVSTMATNQYRPMHGLGQAGGCGCGSTSPDGMGSLYNTESGIYRRPWSGGGGVFNRAIDGTEDSSSLPTYLGVAAAFAAGFGVIYLATRKKRK